jgi:hypothetical protein
MCIEAIEESGVVGPDSEVSEMIKHDVLTGLLFGVIVGLLFTPQLTPHLGVIVILAVIFGSKMLGTK